ncbi:glycoside hydrolase family 26 protein [Mucilaginibacter sp. AW1-3]
MQIKTGLFLLVNMLFAFAASAQIYNPCDKDATTETKWLYASMQRLIGAGVIFGHHDDLAYGVGWRGDAGRSDVKSVTGAYPALYGWDLSGMELGHDKDINGIPFEQQLKYIEDVYNRGGINTFCWHLNNPVNGKTAWDTTKNSVSQLVPGGAHHQDWVDRLDKIAEYLKSLKGKDGEPVPILFRPFHELTGSWFWWGKDESKPEDFKNLWRFTVAYLRDKKKLHNLLIVYSVGDNFRNADDFMERYPGDEFVDVVGFDTYCTNNVDQFKSVLNQQLAVTQDIATRHHKLAAIAETGYQGIPKSDWWTNDLMATVSKYPISYMMLWRNSNPNHYYVPYPGQGSVVDFQKMFNSYQTLFQNRITPLRIYGNK